MRIFKFLSLWQKAIQMLNLHDDSQGAVEKGDDEIVRLAYEDVVQAYNVFENAEDSILTEYAIYNLKAAEKRYEYLLKKLRDKQNVCKPCVTEKDARKNSCG